jgi:drug/metabolite transporter (DMT)-like permease
VAGGGGVDAGAHIQVSFIQILKALSPVFTLTVLSMFGLEKPTLPLIGSVMVIAVGTAIAATGEIQFSWPGTIMMVRGARLRV